MSRFCTIFSLSFEPILVSFSQCKKYIPAELIFLNNFFGETISSINSTNIYSGKKIYQKLFESRNLRQSITIH